jgi:hypothetical protein
LGTISDFLGLFAALSGAQRWYHELKNARTLGNVFAVKNVVGVLYETVDHHFDRK